MRYISRHLSLNFSRGEYFVRKNLVGCPIIREKEFLSISKLKYPYMEYKLIYRPYDLSRLVEQARGEKGTWFATKETGDWNNALNEYAKQGWKVKNSGVIEAGREIVFWALLEKDQ
jgi:hypothetical protein